jgi:hypothetical protein
MFQSLFLRILLMRHSTGQIAGGELLENWFSGVDEVKH